MGEVIWVDGGRGGGVFGGDVHVPAREGVFEDAEHGEVIIWVGDGVGGEEEGGVGHVLGADASRQEDLLRGGFVGVEEFVEGEFVLLAQAWGGVGVAGGGFGEPVLGVWGLFEGGEELGVGEEGAGADGGEGARVVDVV